MDSFTMQSEMRISISRSEYDSLMEQAMKYNMLLGAIFNEASVIESYHHGFVMRFEESEIDTILKYIEPQTRDRRMEFLIEEYKKEEDEKSKMRGEKADE